jgi:hypothetical protein
MVDSKEFIVWPADASSIVGLSKNRCGLKASNQNSDKQVKLPAF